MSWNDLRKGRHSQVHGEYFITFNTKNREPHFNNFNIACLFSRQIAIHELKYQCTWLSWVLMPDHFHGLLYLGQASTSLSQVVGTLKGSSSFTINKQISKNTFNWQPSFYDRALRSEDNRKDIARYIVANPLRKGLVKNINDYPFWNSVYL